MIKYLKICLFAVNSYLSGNPLKDTRALGGLVGLRHGLPKVLPVSVRAGIRRQDLSIIRRWVSILNMYKGFRGPYGPPSLATIQAPQITDYPESRMGMWAVRFWQVL